MCHSPKSHVTSSKPKAPPPKKKKKKKQKKTHKLQANKGDLYQAPPKKNKKKTKKKNKKTNKLQANKGDLYASVSLQTNTKFPLSLGNLSTW